MISFEKQNGDQLKEKIGGEIYSSESGLHYSEVWKCRYEHPELAQVTIRTQIQAAGDNFDNTAEQTTFLDDD